MQKVNARTVTLIIIFLLMLVVVALLIGNFTFSYLGADVGDDVTNQGETTASGDTIIFSSGNNLSLHATTDNFNASSGNLTDTTNPSVRLIASNKTNEATSTYYAGVRINTNTYTYSSGTTADVILTVRDETGALVTTSDDNNLIYVTVTDSSGTSISGFDITGKTGSFNISKEHPISTTSSTSGTTQTWTFTITFVNYTYDQSINENATLDMEVILQKDEITLGNAAEYIARLYTIDGENGLYYHDGTGTYGTLEAGDNSYRYTGANPNNYVCFGSDEASCPADNLYRIIGVFGNQVKLIKADFANSDLLGTDGDYSTNVYNKTDYANYKGNKETINRYYWNNNTSTNTWSESQLNTVNLNTNYLNGLGSEWAEKIAITEWKVGGNTWVKIAEQNAPTAYQNEIVNPAEATTYSAKIGLMYVSDYGYAASPENWNTDLVDYDNATNTNNNWMYSEVYEWTISRTSDLADYAFNVGFTGRVDGYVYSDHGVRPSFYLESSVEFSRGNGTEQNPYRIQL